MKIEYSYLVLILLFIPLLGHSQSNLSISHHIYHQYAGDYIFEDGTIITGGPMDEVQGSLVFMDPIKREIGGIFKAITKDLFASLYSEENKFRFDFDKDETVKGLWWISGNNEIYAEKNYNPRIKEIEFENDVIIIKGELYLPKGQGPFPVVINVHGSGPQTRHAGPWNTFFLRYGIAVLCYDKRGAGESGGNFSTAGYTDFASDVLAAIEFAKQHPLIDSTRIGLHGSSEGGWVASMAAAQYPELNFMIVRVGSGVSGSDTYLHEVKMELKEKNLSRETYLGAVRFERTIQEMAGDDKPLEEINQYISTFKKSHEWYPEVFGNYNSMSRDYYIKLKKSGPIDPADYLRQIKCIPVLWFLAEKDENVPYELSKPRIQDALEEAGNDDFEIITIPNAPHSFIVETKSGQMSYAAGYWDKMLEWLKEHKIAIPD